MNYRIQQSSQILYIITFLLTLLIGIVMIISFFPKGKSFLLFVLFFLPFFFLAFYLPKFTSIAEIEILLDDNGFKRKWIKQFLFQKRKDDDIKWSDIKNYVFQPDKQFDKFKLTLKNGRTLAFYHNNDFDNKDDFKNFLDDFISKVEEINTNQIKNNSEKILIGKTIYETTYGLVIAVFSVTIIIVIPLLLFFSPKKGSLSWSTVLGLFSSAITAIYFVFQVYIHRKRRKEYEKKNE